MRKVNNYWWLKTTKDNKDKMDEILRERVKIGKDIKTQSYNTLLTKMLRYNEYVNKIKQADFIKEKKEDRKLFRDSSAQFFNSPFMIFRFMIVAFLAVILLGGMIYVTGLLNNAFHDVGIRNEGNAGLPGYVNLTEAADDIWGQMNSGVRALRLVAFTLIFGEIMLMILLSAFVRKHPALFFVHVLIVFLAVMFAAPVSNAYETIMLSGVYEGGLLSFTGANWILLNLPLVTLLTGILGGLFMFINIVRGGGEEPL